MLVACLAALAPHPALAVVPACPSLRPPAGVVVQDGISDASAGADTEDNIASAVDQACLWLATHQDVDGKWDADAFTKHDGEGRRPDDTEEDDDAFWDRVLDGDDPLRADTSGESGAGSGTDAGDPEHDVGVTALALLALLDDGNTPDAGAHKLSVARAVEWLLLQQDADTGLFGSPDVHAIHYDHAIATLALARISALCDGAIGTGERASTQQSRQGALERAVYYILRARNPYAAWRYDSPPSGDNDTSITTWMVLALTAAEQAGVKVDLAAYEGANAWIDAMTDPKTGRVGYTTQGSQSSRIAEVNDELARDPHETLTAGALLAKLRMGAEPRSDAHAVRHVKLLLATQSKRSTRGPKDMIELRWGTEAMSMIGSRPWVQWSKQAAKSILVARETEGSAAGSWGPATVWGHSLGRVGTTALAASALAQMERHGATASNVTSNAAPPKAPTARPGAPERLDVAVQRGLQWLVQHQDDSGKWDADAFHDHDPANGRTDGAGAAFHDVGVTGLAVLAFLGDGQTPYSGPDRDAVKRAVQFLMKQQDPETGRIGDETHYGSMYDHGAAALALTESYMLTKAPALEARAQQAVNFIVRARNPYGAWRYEVPPNGDNDTSVTAWMIQVLRSAEDAGLKIDRQAYEGARSWIDAMTDPVTGRVGYIERGSGSSRVLGKNDDFPPSYSEALTAAGLYVRFLAGESPDGQPLMDLHADLLMKNLPGRPDQQGPDAYALYYASRALFQLGGRDWDVWRKHVDPLLRETQRVDGAFRGSWDPSGPWGYVGGRVYSTAMMTLTAQSLARYGALVRPVQDK